MIFSKPIKELNNSKVYDLSQKEINNILKIRKQKIELDPGMGGVDPYSLDKLLEKSKLVSLDIAITAGCNFKCKWCYRPENEWGVMFHSFSKIKSIIKEALSIGIKYFIITGGEPLIYKDKSKTYFDIIDFIYNTYKNNNIKPNILTFSDVGLITKDIAQKIADRKISLCLKRDTLNANIQNEIIGVKNGNIKIQKGYKNLINAGYGLKDNLYITVNTVLAKNIPGNNIIIDTTTGLIDLHMWIKKNNFEHSIVPIHYCGEAETSEQKAGINPLDIKVLYDILSAIDEIEFNDIWKVYSAFPKNKTCNRPGRGVHIRATGDITSCSESPLINNYIFGNINKNTLTKAILSDKFLDFREEFNTREGKYICNSKTCDLYKNKLCKGGCATRSAYSRININNGLIEQNECLEAYTKGREDPLCPGWIILAKKQNALKNGIYEKTTEYYLSRTNISSTLKQKIKDKIINDFHKE